MAHHTKDKGDLGVAMVIADLARHDILCCTPLSEHLAFDLIAVSPDQEKLCRVQVKYRAATNGFITVPLRSTWADRHGSHISPIDRSKFDAYAIYCPETDRVYYVSSRDIPESYTTSITLRLTPPANNQKKDIRLAQDYLNPEYLFD